MRDLPRLDRDVGVLGIFATFLAGQLVAPWLRGLVPFWGDLTYIHHPWRAFDAQVLQAGRLPLWDPHLYFGMPAAAAMQNSLFYPGSVPFFLFGFSDALLLFHLFAYGLSAALTFLWLRSCGLRRTSALCGAGLLCLGGVWLENRPFLNHLAVLALLPGLCLLARRPWMLALALCAACLGGYPQIFAGSALAAFVLALVSSPRRRELIEGWLASGIWAAALSACFLLPAVELVKLSHRSAGVGLEEALQFGFAPRDLAQWISPLLLKSFDPAIEWWKSCFVGFAGLALAARGLAASPRRGFLPSLWLFGVLLLTLGGTTTASAWLWAHLPFLRFVRYPGNFSYLAVPVLALLCARGAQQLAAPLRLAAAGLILIELSAYGWGAFPLADAGLFSSAGPLVRRLQDEKELAGHRYLLSPKALEAGRGAGYEDWKYRLYGLTNAPFRLRAAGNFGEPLVPEANYEVMDRLYRARTADQAAELFAWTDTALLLTPAPPLSSSLLTAEQKTLWNISRLKASVGGAYLLSERDGESLPPDLPAAQPPRTGLPLTVERPREDRFAVAGESSDPGWVYVAEPRYPGWRISLRTERGEGAAASRPAMGAFQKVHVPAGAWRLDFRYEPGSWRWGLSLSVLAWLALMAQLLRRAKEQLS